MKKNTKKVLAGVIACMTLVSSISVQQVSATKVAIETKAEKLAKLSDEKKKSSIGFYKDDVNHQEYDISNA